MADYIPQDSMSLWWLGTPDQPARVGTIDLVNNGQGVSLTYADAWRQDGFALSEDLPLMAQAFMPAEKSRAAGAVDDCRPDRWGERVIRAIDKPSRLSLIEYLYFAGDDRFGALGVSLSPDTYAPKQPPALPSLDDLGLVHDAIRKLASGQPVEERLARLVAPGRTFGGAKPKSLIVIDGFQWVIKFADEYDLDWPLIEHAVMRMGTLCGITMCETRAVPISKGKSAIAVRRFDRRAAGGGIERIHCLSADVALRAAGEDFGYPEVAGVLRRLAPAGQVAPMQRELFRRMVFNLLVDNTDDHEKNHALLRVPDSGYCLSPAFDVVPSAQNLGRQALRVGAAATDSTLDNALSESAAFGLSRNDAAAIVAEICRVTADWRQHLAREGVSKKDADTLEPFLDGAKAAMRSEFSAKAVGQAPSA